MGHFRRHPRFYFSGLAGVAVWAATSHLQPWSLRLIVAGDVFFLVYLTTSALFALPDTADEMRHDAKDEDEGVVFLLFITTATVGLSLFAIFSLINAPGVGRVERLAALVSVPLGWLTLHTVAAFRYAHLYYAPGEEKDEDGLVRDARGLGFPGTAEPDASDFLYFSLVLGMTGQTSDVAVQTRAMRRVVIVHSVIAFFFNTGLLALAVNIAAAYAGGSGG
jgi:uncharacterized membrane protein